MATGAELTYNTGATATQMANAIFGDGVTVVGASYTGDTRSKAIYSNGQLSPGVVPSNTGVILSTGLAASFTQSNGDPNRSSQTSTDTSGANNNAQFNALAGTNTYDASILDVDFIPTGNVMTMTFVFSSEEYPEYASSQFNDTVGIWVNGTNVPLSIGNGTTSVTNISPNVNANQYISNTGDQFNTEMDGFTLKLTLNIPVNPGVVNSIRIGVADVSDASYDSNLLIGADSVQTTLVAADDLKTMTPGQTKTIDVLGNDTNTTGGTLTVTHINGVAVVAGQSVVLPSGDTVTLNADGTLSVTTDSDADTFSFTYGVQSSTGASDIGVVTVDTIPCFVAGTRIRTPAGEVAVEDLRPGDLVMTLDHGAQPLRWTGRRRVEAQGRLAPVRIAAGTFGSHGTLLVSPQHRILIRDGLAGVLFGEEEVLVAAKDLVDKRRVRQASGGTVVYVHLLFDRHQVIFAEGLATESFLPGPQTSRAFEQEIVDEILTIFPGIDLATGAGYGPAARRALRSYEAQLLVNGGVAA